MHANTLFGEGDEWMAEWRQLSIPNICERMIGFSVPQDDAILVVSYEGMHLVRLSTPVTVESDSEYTEYDLYDPDSGVCRYRGREWNIIGLSPGCPMLIGRDNEQLLLSTEAQTVSVVRGDEEEWSFTYENFSGDWAAATFSPDGRFIVLGCPYGFDFRVWMRSPDTTAD
jgi:hypothetical protein